MHELAFFLNGLALTLNPSPRLEDGLVAVPAQAFAVLVGAQFKDLDGQPAVCRGELCIPLADDQLLDRDGTLFMPLAAVAEPLSLNWSLDGHNLQVKQSATEPVGLGVGSPPPAFALPDLTTGQPMGLQSFAGKKTVFYMWASW